MINQQILPALPEVIRILKSHKVKRAYVFGSACTDRFSDDSDLDLLVAFDISEPFDGYAQNFWDMEDKLQQLLKRKVDLVPEHTLQNPYFIKMLEQTKTPLYE